MSTALGPISAYLTRDHARLDALLEQATADPAQIDLEAYAQFRVGLLRHIGMEEKILFPAARRALDGAPLPGHARLRADHGRLTALMVPSPTGAIIAELRSILEPHDELEEGRDGVYALCERLIGDDAEAVLIRLEAAHDPPVRPHFDGRRPLLLDQPHSPPE